MILGQQQPRALSSDDGGSSELGARGARSVLRGGRGGREGRGGRGGRDDSSLAEGGGIVGGGRPFRGASSRALQVGGGLGEDGGGGGIGGGSGAQGRVNGNGNDNGSGHGTGSDGNEGSRGEYSSMDRDELVETLRDRVAGLEAGQVRVSKSYSYGCIQCQCHTRLTCTLITMGKVHRYAET